MICAPRSAFYRARSRAAAVAGIQASFVCALVFFHQVVSPRACTLNLHAFECYMSMTHEPLWIIPKTMSVSVILELNIQCWLIFSLAFLSWIVSLMMIDRHLTRSRFCLPPVCYLSPLLLLEILWWLYYFYCETQIYGLVKLLACLFIKKNLVCDISSRNNVSRTLWASADL